MHDLDAALAGVDLLAIIEKDTRLSKVAQTNGGEWAGPCPLCPGGVDRFRVWPRHSSGRGRFWCRGGDGHGCGRSGDAISYLQERDGLTFKEALAALGLDVDRVVPSGSRRRRAARSTGPVVEDVQPPGEKWQARARQFVEYAQGQLWGDAGQGARRYLVEVRGLQEATIQRFGLGLNPQCLYDKPVGKWGFDDGKAVYLSKGIVLPCELDGVIWYIQIRRPLEGGTLLAYLGGEPVKYNPPDRPPPKYWAARGSVGKGLFNAQELRGTEALLFCEGEFDTMLAHQALGDLVDVVTMGGASKSNRGLPGRWLLMLAPYKVILVAYDVDGAGRSGAAVLAQHSKRVRRVTVPRGGDVVGFYQAGGDLRAWLTFHLDRLGYLRKGAEGEAM